MTKHKHCGICYHVYNAARTHCPCCGAFPATQGKYFHWRTLTPMARAKGAISVGVSKRTGTMTAKHPDIIPHAHKLVGNAVMIANKIA